MMFLEPTLWAGIAGFAVAAGLLTFVFARRWKPALVIALLVAVGLPFLLVMIAFMGWVASGSH